MRTKTNLKPRTIGTLLLAVTVSCLAATSASATSPGFCEGYAKSAVHQYNRNIVKGCGYAGWRWHAWYKGHYQWCRSTSKHFARSERIQRFVMLKQCW